MRPDLTGRAHGRALVAAVLDYATGAHPDTTLRVTIAGFNARAQRVWQSARFEEQQRLVRASDDMEFQVMTRPPE